MKSLKLPANGTKLTYLVSIVEVISAQSGTRNGNSPAISPRLIDE